MTDIPYAFDESLRGDFTCDGSHSSRHVKYEGPLWIEICLDPKCAKVFAKCEHQVVDEDRARATPLAPTISINTWNDNGTVLTCQYCGADVT
jgi:hypothetical protein